MVNFPDDLEQIYDNSDRTQIVSVAFSENNDLWKNLIVLWKL